ncbi:MAG: PEFG-CTERM sorting domain-containing protein [Candidatus Micrarchaeota archaeon]|nr:PEFG-CTERM sorting domain-containing protein [Candidatus Micrarchaeota archaeon]
MSKALIAVLLLVAGLGIVPAFSTSSFDWNSCQGDHCFVHVPSLEQHPYNFPPFIKTGNQVMDIFLPDGTCNLTGKIQTDGSCSSPSIVLSIDNYTRLQNNVAFMAVLNIADTSSTENVSYCKLAQGIYNGQTAEYQKKLVNVTQFVVPNDCMGELGSLFHVPEFGMIAALVLVIAIVSILAVSAKTGLRFMPNI